MVHTFKCLGRFFALDVESGSVFEIDETAKKLIDAKISSAGAGDFSNFEKAFECETAAQAEIDSLIAEGCMFSEERTQTITKSPGIIKALCLNISHNCNLKCAYCFADGGNYSSEKGNMSANTAKAAIDFLISRSGSRKNLEVDFFGGEPLLNIKTVKETVEYARRREREEGKNFRFTVTTNGLLLDDSIIEFFNKEMHNVVISIDGRENVHNFVRKSAAGAGNFKEVLDAALRFRKQRGGKYYYIRGTFTSLNKDFALDALALNDYGFDQISLEPVVLPQGNSLALKESDLPQLEEQYEYLAAEYVKRRKTGKWFSFFHFNLDLSAGPCLKKRLTGCGAGCEYIAVSPDGDIYPCPRFDGKKNYRMGNVLRVEFDETLPKIFAASSVLTKQGCKDCFCKYFCSGGCAANSIEYGGGIDARYEISCALMKKRTECALAVYAIERENHS